LLFHIVVFKQSLAFSIPPFVCEGRFHIMSDADVQSPYLSDIGDEFLALSLSMDPRSQEYDVTVSYNPIPEDNRAEWRHFLESPGGGRFSFIHGKQTSDIKADNTTEAQRIIAEKFPGVGGILVDKEALKTTERFTSPLAKVH
jgi:hypothetical protein